MAKPHPPSGPSTAQASKKQKKKGQQVRRRKTSSRGPSLAFYKASIATIPNQPLKIMSVSGKFLKLPGEIRNRIYNEYTEECFGLSAWAAALDLGSTCKQVRAEFLPVFIASLVKIRFRLDKFLELLDICCSPNSNPFLVDELAKQGKTFKIHIEDHRKVCIRSLVRLTMQLRERPNMKVRFKDTRLHSSSQGAIARELNRLTEILRQSAVGSDDVLSEIRFLEIKAPNVHGVCYFDREISVPLRRGWFVEITFRSELAWWDDETERKRNVRLLVRRLGLQPATVSFIGISHLSFSQIPRMCQCTL